MPLHYKTKEAAMKKHGELKEDPEALQKALKGDKNSYTDAEIKEILDAILNPSSVTPAAGKAAKEKRPAGPNDKILEKLQEFDYENMRGETFKDYCLFVQSLQQDTMYDFEQYLVEPIKKVRYRGVKDSPVDTIGFTIKNNKPVNTTRVPVKHALQTNGFVKEYPEDGFFEVLNGQFHHNGRFFLLKK